MLAQMEQPKEVAFRRRTKSSGSRKRPRSPVQADTDVPLNSVPDAKRSVRPASEKSVAGREISSDVISRNQYQVDDDDTRERKKESREQDRLTAKKLLAEEPTDDQSSRATNTTTRVKAKAFGPRRAPSNVRTSVRVDYQPDVCKDYKETGYCGFGDACKFLHDRTDYKAGWELDREWADKQQARREAIARGEDPDIKQESKHTTDTDMDGLPFACFICRGPFRSPMVTLCGHYFCESCAIERMTKQATCAVCNKHMRGVLNVATKLLERASTDAAQTQAT